jgi:hypothetical protein
VKNNVFGMLGSLAISFGKAELDVLFKKCEGWRKIPLADAMKIVGLMRRLCLADRKVRPEKLLGMRCSAR